MTITTTRTHATYALTPPTIDVACAGTELSVDTTLPLLPHATTRIVQGNAFDSGLHYAADGTFWVNAWISDLVGVTAVYADQIAMWVREVAIGHDAGDAETTVRERLRKCAWLEPARGHMPLLVERTRTPHVVLRFLNEAGRKLYLSTAEELPKADGQTFVFNVHEYRKAYDLAIRTVRDPYLPYIQPEPTFQWGDWSDLPTVSIPTELRHPDAD